MKNIIRFTGTLILLTLLFAGCGSAEAIKGYHYATTKDNLEKAVRVAIKSNPNIYHNSIQENKLDSIMAVAEREHSRADSALYYNDGKHYVTIKIKKGEEEIVYIFRYLGDEQYWKTSSSSEIFISEVHDERGNSLSQGHNENGEFSSKMAKDFTDLFEAELVSKIDKELSLKHTDD